MIISKLYMGWSQQNASEFPDVSTTRTIQPVDSNMTRGRTSAFILLDSRTSKVKSLLVHQKVY